MTAEERQEQRQAKNRDRKRRKRLEQGRQTRAQYLASFANCKSRQKPAPTPRAVWLANSISNQKPWLDLGIKSKRSYYRWLAKQRGTGPGTGRRGSSGLKLATAENNPLDLCQLQSRKEVVREVSKPKARRKAEKYKKTEALRVTRTSVLVPLACTADTPNVPVPHDIIDRRNSRTADERLDPDTVDTKKSRN